MAINRRKFHRIPGSLEQCILKMDSSQLVGSLADESIAGAKICEIDLLVLAYNKPMRLEYRDGAVDVRARNTTRDVDGKFILGLVRNETLSPEQLELSTAMLVNCYVQYGEAYVICMPVRIETETHALIQLWDGVQFRVPRSQLKPLTRAERFEMLADEKCLSYTAKMYGISSDGDLRKEIFEHEFGVFEGCPICSAEPVAS